MKLAFVTSTGGGVDPYVRTTAKYLVQYGHTVHIIYLGPPPWDPQIDNLYIHTATGPGNIHYYIARLGFGKTRYPAIVKNFEYTINLARALREIQQQHGLDLVELTGAAHWPSLYNNIPFIYKMHGADWTFRHYCEDGKYYKFELQNEHNMILRSRQTYALSRSLADFIAGACSVPRSMITVTPYPIDIDEFRPRTPPLQGPPFRLMAVGRLEKRKGTHTLIEALQMVWSQEPDTHLYLYGSNGDFGKDQIEAAIPPEVHCGRIHFEGFVSRKVLIEHYQQAHIYVTPTRYETFGYTILEAMACGRPVIASDIGPVPELVRHEDTGWLFPRDDTHALAATILTALNDPAKREQYGDEGRRIAERYNTDAVMKRQIMMYEEALHNQPAS